MKKTFIITTFLILLSGCGSSGGTSDSSIVGDPTGSLESGEMSIGKIYAMYQGDSVKKLSDIASIKVTHQNESTGSSIELLSGKATINRVK